MTAKAVQDWNFALKAITTIAMSAISIIVVSIRMDITEMKQVQRQIQGIQDSEHSTFKANDAFQNADIQNIKLTQQLTDRRIRALELRTIDRE